MKTASEILEGLLFEIQENRRRADRIQEMQPKFIGMGSDVARCRMKANAIEDAVVAVFEGAEGFDEDAFRAKANTL